MSLKSIDMSIAVHKNADAGLIQRELQNKPMANQAALVQAGLKNDVSNRHRAPKLDETDKSRIRDNRKGSGNNSESQSSDEEEKSSGPESRTHTDSTHPYKGRHIDFSM